MERNIRQTLIVGALTIFATVGAVVFMHAVKKGISTRSYRVWALLPDANGLYKKSKVMIAGVIVGEIVSIKLQGTYARIDLKIREDVKLYRDASIAKVNLGLLGDKALVLDPGDPKTGFIGDGGQIKNIKKVGLSAVIDKAVPKIGEAIPHLVRLSKTLGDLADGPSQIGRGSVREIAESLRVLAKALSQSVQNNRHRFDKIIRAVERVALAAAKTSQLTSQQIVKILRDVREITKNIKKLSTREEILAETLANLQQITSDLKDLIREVAPASSKHLRKSLASLDKTLDNIRSISEKIEKGQGTIGKLINDDKVITKVENTLADINKLVRKFSLLETSIGWQTQYYVKYKTFRNAFSIKLQLSPDKYYTIGLIDDPRGTSKTVKKLIKSSDPRKPQFVEEEETLITDSFRVSLQLNYKFWLFVLRGGIIENTGGIGLDFLPYKDYFVLSSELFNIGLQRLPRLRISLLLNYKFLSVSGGVDELLNPGQTDFFFGIGLRITDNDLKYLLPSLPLPK